MQAIEYRDPEGNHHRTQELFEAACDADVWDKMRARFAELEKDHEIVSMSRKPLTKNQAKRLRKKGF